MRHRRISQFVFCFGDDSHQRGARHSHHREDRRDAETADCVCTILFYLNSNSNKIYHSICQQIDKSGIRSTSQPWIKDMRTAVQNVPKVCLAIAKPRKFDITSLRAWILHTGPPSQFVESYFMSTFNDISCGTKDNEKECLANAKLVSLYATRFGKGQ